MNIARQNQNDSYNGTSWVVHSAHLVQTLYHHVYYLQILSLFYLFTHICNIFFTLSIINIYKKKNSTLLCCTKKLMNEAYCVFYNNVNITRKQCKQHKKSLCLVTHQTPLVF